MTIEVRRVDASVVRPLRHSVLRAGEDPSESVYRADELPDTVHLAALHGDVIVGTATVFPEPCGEHPAWRLRGMAVDERTRGAGIGSTLLHEVLVHVRGCGAGLIWCNARTVAVPFYTGHGFTVVGGEFLVGSGVPHYLALRELGSGEEVSCAEAM